jgi:hypothetical protein
VAFSPPQDRRPCLNVAIRQGPVHSAESLHPVRLEELRIARPIERISQPDPAADRENEEKAKNAEADAQGQAFRDICMPFVLLVMSGLWV